MTDPPTMPPMMYRLCSTCAAPLISPFPDIWTFDLIKEGPRSGPVGAFGTPHRDTCTAPVPTPEPGIAVRMSGANVSGLNISIPAPAATERKHPVSLIDRDDDGEARYELDARGDLPEERCPDCECCTKADCWRNACGGGTCPCTEFRRWHW